jgi:hypothetical protein
MSAENAGAGQGAQSSSSLPPEYGAAAGKGNDERHSAAPDYGTLLHWARERYSIRCKRAAGLPPPWTDDPVLAAHRFCNASREHDRVTIWIRQNIRERYVGHP